MDNEHDDKPADNWRKGYIRINYTPTGLIVAGLLGLLSVIIFELACPIASDKNIAKAIVNFVSSIFAALFIAGGVSLVLELNDFTDYFDSHLKSILIGGEYIKNLNKKTKQKLHQSLEEEIYFHGREKDQDSFYYVVKRDMERLLTCCHLDSFSIIVNCDVGANVIEKKFERKTVYKNPNNNHVCPVHIPLDIILEPIEGLNPDDLYSIDRIKIGKDELTAEELEKAVDLKNEPVTIKKRNFIKYSASFKLDVEKESYVEIDCTTRVPISDNTFCHRVTQPCRSYEAIFNVNEGYTISGCGFGFRVKDHEDVLITPIGKQGLQIQMLGWILPGDGSSFSITPTNFFNQK